jgi:hypothetical protein
MSAKPGDLWHQVHITTFAIANLSEIIVNHGQLSLLDMSIFHRRISRSSLTGVILLCRWFSVPSLSGDSKGRDRQ